MELTPEVIAFIGVFLGCLARTVLPYLKKARDAATENKPFKFDYKFAITSVVAFIESIVVSILLFTKVPIDVSISGVYLFISSFSWAYTTNDFINTSI
jgi:hypothetical protein